MSEPCSCGSSCGCGCCEGTEPLTPQAITNRPGLDALAYRMGTHSSFLETMKARLSSQKHPRLEGLTTRDAADPSLALLDAWAVVGDVLTFYQERIANEGYLRTATERRSVLELARLVGYAPRPGVAASTYLAYTVDEGPEAQIPAGSAARSVPGPGELPQVFETMEDLTARAAWNNLQVRLTRPQSWLTWLEGKKSFVYLKGISTQLRANDPVLIGRKGQEPELYRVKKVESDVQKDRTRIEAELWVKDSPSSQPLRNRREFLGEMDKLLDSRERGAPSRTASSIVAVLRDLRNKSMADIEESDLIPLRQKVLRSLKRRSPKAVHAWLKEADVLLEDALSSGVFRKKTQEEEEEEPSTISQLVPDALLKQLSTQPRRQPRSSAHLERSLEDLLLPESDASGKLLSLAQPSLQGTLFAALENATVSESPDLEVYALRVRASLFGHNAPKQIKSTQPNSQTPSVIEFQTDEWNLSESTTEVFLDAPYPQIQPDSWIVLQKPRSTASNGSKGIIITKVEDVIERSRAEYGIAAKVSQLTLKDPWRKNSRNQELNVVREIAVFAQSELLPLAEEPIPEPVCNQEIELASLYDGLKTGRWLIVSGERADVKQGDQVVPGILASELVMISGVEHRVNLVNSEEGRTRQASDGVQAAPGERTHTFLTLAKKLQHCYRRDTLKIYGNVAKATHGETRFEVLGSGDASKPLQSFTLKQPPLTYVSAPTPSGIESTLKVRVNDVLWREADCLPGLKAMDRRYIVRIDDGGQTTVVFGNGECGARLPTGPENVRATYRNGIGKPGNVKARQISQLGSRPLGVKDVINPLPATGGADRESRDQARRNVPLAVLALDRLVSIQDYEDFARTFAGVGKAKATDLSDGRVKLVHVTIAGEDDIPIGKDSELIQNLETALRRFGDPRQPLALATRTLLFLVVEAEVKVLPDYLWEKVEPKIRAAMLEAFGFNRRDLAQPAMLSEAVRVIQGVPGVDFVDINVFTTRDPEALDAEIDVGQPVRLKASLASPDRVDEDGDILGARLIYLTSEVPDTLILKERKS